MNTDALAATSNSAVKRIPKKEAMPVHVQLLPKLGPRSHSCKEPVPLFLLSWVLVVTQKVRVQKLRHSTLTQSGHLTQMFWGPYGNCATSMAQGILYDVSKAQGGVLATLLACKGL